MYSLPTGWLHIVPFGIFHLIHRVLYSNVHREHITSSYGKSSQMKAKLLPPDGLNLVQEGGGGIVTILLYIRSFCEQRQYSAIFRFLSNFDVENRYDIFHAAKEW